LKQLTELIELAIKHEGFSFINVFSPCVTFNKINTYDWFKDNIVDLAEFPDYDPSNRVMAMSKIMETNGLLTGLIYQDKSRKAYEDLIPGFKQEALVNQNIEISKEDFEKLVAEFR
jgi:2-oxoglutarate ferredoxin oxidoreductase subunit beta